MHQVTCKKRIYHFRFFLSLFRWQAAAGRQLGQAGTGRQFRQLGRHHWAEELRFLVCKNVGVGKVIHLEQKGARMIPGNALMVNNLLKAYKTQDIRISAQCMHDLLKDCVLEWSKVTLPFLTTLIG